jgi:Co/Zn/Cd efflux system component
VFLLFAVVEIISESFERVITPQEVLPEKMLVVSFLGLLVNVVGLFFFHNHGHIHSEDVDE